MKDWDEAKEAIAAFTRDRDWEQFHTPKNLSMAIAGEAAELMEHFLWVDGEGSIKMKDDPDAKHAIGEEIADVLILAMQICNVMELSPAEIIAAKMKRNAEKYPVEKAKGNAKKYTEFED